MAPSPAPINYVTKAPNPDEIEGQVYLKAGEEKDLKASGFLSGPLIGDKLLFFASASWESFDGEWQNSMNPCKAGQTAADGCVAFRAQLPGLLAGRPAPFHRPGRLHPAGRREHLERDGQAQLAGRWTTSRSTSRREYTEADDEHFASLFQPELNCYVPGDPDDPRADITDPDLARLALR